VCREGGWKEGIPSQRDQTQGNRWGNTSGDEGIRPRFGFGVLLILGVLVS
jgi:hypothetical protein